MPRIHQTMSQPKPATTTLPQLTAAGKPRQRAPGAGAPHKGRRVHLSRVTPQCLADLQHLANAWHCTLADAIERAATQALHSLSPQQ